MATIPVRFIEAPDLVGGQEYWVIVRTQNRAKGQFQISANSNGVLWTSSDGGELWTEVAGALNLTFYSATPGGVSGLFVAKTSNIVTPFFGFGDSLYRTDALGNVTIQQDGLPNAGRMYFDQTTDEDSNPCVRYTYGGGKPRRISLTDYSEVEITAARDNVHNILLHGAGFDGYLFYFANADPNGVFSSEVVNLHPDGFDVNESFVGEIPAPQVGDDLTAMASLAGQIIFWTRRHKYSLLGDSWQTFSVNDAASNNGTFSQDSVVTWGEVAYYASDDGIYAYDGTSEVDLTGTAKNPRIQNIWDGIPDKDSVVLDVFNNRLYVFYANNVLGYNDSCLIYNMSLNVWESFDTDAFISATCARRNPQNRFLAGLSRVGALVWLEDAGNTHDNLGAPIRFQLSESCRPYGASAQLKRITKWRPEFQRAPRPYDVECGFSFDFAEEINYAFSVQLATSSITYDAGYLYDNGEVWGGTSNSTLLTTRPSVYREWRRCALHYRHHASYEPVSMINHTITIQEQRIR
jgi:hypothetical protein